VIEAVALYLLVLVSANVVFNTGDSVAARHYPVGFVIIPVLVWAAFRLGPRDTSTAVGLIAVLAIFGTLHGLGVFSVPDRNASLLLLQSYMAVLSITFVSLAAAVGQRNRLLLAEQQSRARAESAVRAREEFLSIASHELRTPVASLKGSVQLLQRRRASGELDFARFDRMLVIIGSTADRLTTLVNQLLDVSRIQTDHLDLSAQPLDLSAELRESVERARMYGDGTHSFSLSLNGSSTPVLADPGRLEQVWSNLLDNAVKYSPRGGDIRVRLEATDDDGFEVSVSDSGIGMPAGAEGTIFQPFSRATNATAGQFAGMGLGLYICRKIIERHGGRMWAKSPGENHGTTVRVWLPRYTDREAEQAPASAQ
jgi:signal transduction histidine kinase